MTYKKTWLSYLLWAVYSCTIGVMLANYAILFWQKKIDAVIGYGTIAFVFCVFVGVFGIYFGIRKTLLAVTHSGEKKLIRRRTAVLGEIMLVTGIFLLGIWVRLWLSIQSDMAAVSLTAYYQAAMVRSGEQAAFMVHGASFLYTRCLSLVFAFLGNKVEAAVGFQIFLQSLSLLLVFFAVRKIAGRIPACMTMFVFSISSFYREQIFALTPECLFFVLFLTGVLLIGSYGQAYRGGRWGIAPSVVGAVLTGTCIGILSYLDAVSITLLIMALGIFLDVRLKTDKKRGILLYPVIMASFILALLGMFALDAYLCHGEFVRMAEAWYTLYQSHLPIRYVFYHTQVSMIESFILVILAAFLIASFWNRKEQNASLWMFLLFLLAPTPLAAVGVLPYQVFSVFLWSVLAGIGLQQCFVIRVKPKALPTAEFRPIIEQEAKPEAEHMPEPERKPEAEPAPAPERKPEAESVPEPGTKPAIEPAHTPEPEAEPHPRFIENPLPLPKKHEKREMGYRFDEVLADQQEFDIEVAEDDDFDI